MNKMVSYIHHVSHKEWIFHALPPSSRPWIILAPKDQDVLRISEEDDYPTVWYNAQTAST